MRKILCALVAGLPWLGLSAQVVPPDHVIDTLEVVERLYVGDVQPSFSFTIPDSALRATPSVSLLPAVVDEVPGMFATARGVMGYGVSTGASGTLSIRGIGGQPTTGVLVLLDGHPQFMGLMGHSIADIYTTSSAERVEVSTLPASVLYGSNAMGGVMSLSSPAPAADTLGASLHVMGGSYASFHADGRTFFRSGRLSGGASAAYSRSRGSRSPMGFEQSGGSARWAYDFGQHFTLSSHLNLTHFGASNPGTVSAPLRDNDSRITRGSADVYLDNRFDKSHGFIGVFSNWGYHHIDDGHAPGAAPLVTHFNSADRQFGISARQTVVPYRTASMTLGVDYLYSGGDTWYHAVATRAHITGVSRDYHNLAAYLRYAQSIGRFTASAGLRADHHSHVGFHLIPEGRLRCRITSDSHVQFSVAEGFRAPTLRELYMFPPQNPDLSPERLLSYELSYRHALPRRRLSWGANLFYIRARDMIETRLVEGRPLNLNTGSLRNAGAEAFLRYALSPRWTFRTMYAYLHMQHPTLAAPTHKWDTTVSYAPSSWTFSVMFHLVRGLYTAVSPVTAQEHYALLDARVAYRFRKMECYLSAENLTACRYVINLGYPMPRLTVFGGIRLSL